MGYKKVRRKNVYSAVKTVTSVSLLDQISGKVEGNESRGGGERDQGSGKVEKEEAKGNLACGFGNAITVYSDLLWFLPTRYTIPTSIITTRPAGPAGSYWRRLWRSRLFNHHPLLTLYRLVTESNCKHVAKPPSCLSLSLPQVVHRFDLYCLQRYL